MNQQGPLLERANLLLEQGRYKDAEKYIKQVLEQSPEDDYVLSILARCYLNDGRYDKGIEVIQKAISIDPQQAFYFYLLGFGYYQKELLLPAKEQLQKAIELNPYGAEYFGLLAFVLLKGKHYEDALQKANEGLAVDPENITCLNARSRALNKLKRTDEAIDTIHATLSKDPDNEFTHATLGWNYLERGDHKKASRHFREALRIDPNYESARIGLKESLKSIFLPYKLVAQFSLWMSDKSKQFRWIFFVSIYIIIRIMRYVAENNPELKPFLIPIIVFYFLFLFFTWIANPLANFFLLFHKDGKYSLTRAESIIGISVGASLLSGIALLSYAFYFFPEPPNEILFPSIILIVLTIPLGHLELPLRLKENSTKNWYPRALIAVGLLAIPVLFLSREIGIFLGVVYGVGVLIFTWIGNSRN